MRSQKGFSLIPIIIVIVILLIFGVLFLKPLGNRSSTNEYFDNPLSSKQVLCPDPFIFQLPINIDKATSVLYPGQIRGGDYKAHGGFRFDNSLPSEITVTVPYDAQVIAGARYPADTGEIQYTFDFAHPCGIRYRFGHLLTLTPKFQAIAEKFPLPKGLDSRTTEVYPPVEVKQGEVIATAVGLTKGGSDFGGVNAFVDWGVYDYRQKNESSKDPAWAAEHTSETYQYAVCWFDWIPPADKANVLALPSSDGQSGKTSDYCK
ncbi:MAG: hypothetical protein A3F31_03020 [Candidatus Levybacteria bacterium RIFCSPHIGHO2_12_FULL_38_12]|nr:MAG: hypothetical protein A2770_00580 [Candidatus Levybacteria bacterium RIFCSPHIGHO2_01_FULL_38_12]OGH22660.1 MAG: hypothetical protein A3F31_03020 [Candidatus Levybacteria bacterium RIFCSPHIGHO2_12_FULL_38_12]OGH44999.1 MAG: hypothetical protein A3J14_03940 [Candidatus Levybacteria bacterium RIFCSPLOWO2_02_FULL_37_18]